MFEGSVKPGQAAAFRDYVDQRLVPLWCQFEGADEVRVLYAEESDGAAPDIPLILAITYPDHDAMARALDCEARYVSRDLLPELFDRYFDGRLHHHVMETRRFID
jgi:hypothetical protein